MELQDKIVVVTGSSSGIGKGIALKFASEGSKVVVTYHKNHKGGESTLDTIKAKGGNAILKQLDISNEDSIKKLFNDILDTFGTIDILINNAGSALNVPFMNTNKDHWIKVFEDNFFGAVMCTQEAIKILKKNKSGKIINTASIAGIENYGRSGIIAYCAAKAALINFTKTIAKEVAPDILVNAISPGRTDTPYYDSIDENLKSELINKALVKRFIKPSEIADAFVFVSKNDAITGSHIIVDLGATINI